MMSICRARPSFALILLVSLSALKSRAETSPEIRVASALFGQFETVAYAKTDFLFDRHAFAQSTGDPENKLRFPFIEFIGGVNTLNPTAASVLKANYQSVFAGARDFVSPQGFGMVSSHQCFIAISEHSVPDIGSTFQRAAVEQIAGRHVWSWSIPPSEGESGPTKFYALQLSNIYFVMSNNAEDLIRMITALTSLNGSDATKISALGWESFSRYSYWAYRQLRRQGVKDLEASGLDHLAADVSALVFFADVQDRKAFVRIYMSDGNMTTAPQIFPDSAEEKLADHGSGVWEASIPLTVDQARNELLFRIFYYFGFGVSA